VTLDQWSKPAQVVLGFAIFAGGAGISWATLDSKAEAAQQSAASANAAVKELAYATSERIDSLETATDARLKSLEDQQRLMRDSQIRSEEQLRTLGESSRRMDGRLEVLLDRTDNPRTTRR
jgi:small-conductance mechanosensitive channel